MTQTVDPTDRPAAPALDHQASFDAEFEQQLARAQAAMPYIQTVRDERAARREAIECGILARMENAAYADGAGQGYAGMSLLEIVRELAETQGINTRGMTPLQLARTAFHTTSDFPIILGNVAQKRIRGVYEQNPATYQRWARRAPDAVGFQQIRVAQISGAPDLLKVNEHGEFTIGTVRESGESYALVTAGRLVNVSRRAIINDDLRAFDTLLRGFALAAARFENVMVYGILTGNANMADGQPLFSGPVANVRQSNVQSGPTSALSIDALNTGRGLMRRMTGLNGEQLNTAPRYLIVPSVLEHTAYQLTSRQFVPAQATGVNEFREGGAASLVPIVEPLLDADSATRWYLAAATSQIDTVEYCYLEGSEGPSVEVERDYKIDGINIKCRLDFGAKAIDHRGLHRSAGA